ncbi:hypothetical protein DFH09DRAFT_1306520 [Mycena vulgaris]|nr:hypothetical protein DFH09DRAFT_1306520 [Mycena vulgaris]
MGLPHHVPACPPSPKPAPIASLPIVPTVDVQASRTPTPVAVLLAHAPVPRRKPSVVSQATRASTTTSNPPPARAPLGPLHERVASEDIYDVSPSDDLLIMLIVRLEQRRAAPLPPSPPASRVTVAAKPKPASSRACASISGGRRRKTSLVLKSFMDFHNDKDSSSRWSLRNCNMRSVLQAARLRAAHLAEGRRYPQALVLRRAQWRRLRILLRDPHRKSGHQPLHTSALSSHSASTSSHSAGRALPTLTPDGTITTLARDGSTLTLARDGTTTAHLSELTACLTPDCLVLVCLSYGFAALSRGCIVSSSVHSSAMGRCSL